MTTKSMDVIRAIKTRRTIRGYKPDPVPRQVLREILEVAQFSPSWGNAQPWEFAVIGGEVMEAIKKANVEKTAASTSPYSDIPAPTFAEPLLGRTRENTRLMYESMGIGREDRERRRQWGLFGAQAFGAPNGIIIFMDKSLGPWSTLDVGAVMQSIMLAALSYGLGTSPLYNMVRYPDILRRTLGIPESKQIVCGIAIGYPDENAPQNRYERQREPVERVATWHGV